MVTVIIPTYKRARYITRAIDSVLRQTYDDFEIIVVDDNSPNTKEREDLEKQMEKYKDNSKVIFVQHEKNKNGSAARNTGIKMAKGEYITFLDDDDFYLKDRLKILTQALDNNEKYDAVYSGGVILYKDIFEANVSGNFQKNILKRQTFLKTGSNMFFRAGAIKDINGFDESFIRLQDLEVMARFFRKYEILAVNKILVVKDYSDRINELNVNMEKEIKIREHYLKTFQDDIDKYDDKNNIIQSNYIELLIKASKMKDKKYYNILKEKVLEYGNINFKLKLKLILYNMFKNDIYIKIKAKLQELSVKIRIEMLDKNISKEIKDIVKEYNVEE